MLIAATICVSTSVAADETPSFFERVESSVVTIQVPGRGTGSGFFIDRDGTIATNYHVIEGAGEVNIIFHDKSSVPAIGFRAISQGKDLALLVVAKNPEGVVPLPLAARPPDKGDKVFAFGAPLGLEGSVSDGIVSATRTGSELQRMLADGDRDPYRKEMGYDLDADWIQTSAPVSSGNSGGPLVNEAGQVVGVNTFKLLRGENLNFAVLAAHVSSLAVAAPRESLPFSKLPPPRETKKETEAPSTDSYEVERRERDGDIADAMAELERWRVHIANFEAQVEEEALRHPGRAAYLSAKAEAAVFTAQIANLNQEGLRQQGQLAAANRQIGLTIAQLRQQYAAEIAQLDSTYQRQRQFGQGTDQQTLLDSYRADHQITTLRYESLSKEALRRHELMRTQFEGRINELVNQKTFIADNKLAPILVKQQPYLDFLTQAESTRNGLLAQLKTLEKQLKKTENLARGLAAPREEDTIARRKLVLAKNLWAAKSSAAKERFTEVINEHPESFAAEQAKAWLANINGSDLPPALQLSSREWNARTGGYKLEARLAGYVQDKVSLQNVDGTVVEVPLDKLSDADRQYVHELYGE
ncbi:trypsin-like peptidase domain-containing protein [Lignipirellula cremea]|nr:trypsin-like peptidase domain-containing protein [Lignipirellula cremea]